MKPAPLVPLASIFASLLVALLLTGCGEANSHVDPDVDCTERCDPDCELERPFDFEDYQGDCSPAEEPPFCVPGLDGECVDPEFDVEELTIAALHQALESGEINCQWVVGEFQRRALWHDLYLPDEGDAPLNAFVYLNEEAMETARRLDEYQRCEGELSGPMHCVPFGIKSNYASKEVPVTNGSFAFLEAQAGFDAFTVDRLRAAGAVVLGTMSMDEFAFGANGLSGRSGRTANPYARDRNSGGSSAGSAVATAANLMMGGLGTDNCSSVTVPAAYNGLFTLRSSHHLVSTAGIVPSNRLDAVSGPMTRTAEDLARFLTEMAAFNPHYGPHCAEEIPDVGDFRAALDPQAFEGVRVGVLRAVGDDPDSPQRPFHNPPTAVAAHFEEVFEHLEALGAEVVDDIELDELSLDRSSSGSGVDMDRFLEGMISGPSSFEEICETDLYSHSTFSERSQCMSRARQSTSNLQGRLSSGFARYADNRDYVESVLDQWDLDVLIYPADTAGGAQPRWIRTNCILASVTGLPTVVFPTGETSAGLPIGMSLTGRNFDDARLVGMAYAYEQAHPVRRPPPLPQLDGPAPYDLPTFNDLHYELGLAAFEEVMRDHDKFDLTDQRFREIAEDVLGQP